MTKLLQKWKPILDNIFTPYELDQELLEMVAIYIEDELEKDSTRNQYATLIGNGVGPVSPSSTPPTPQIKQQEVFGVLLEFKKRLLEDVDIRVNVKNVHYNKTINRIVYELENGDSVYMESKPFVMRDPNYIKKSKNIFLSLTDPNNPRVRKMKIEEIKKNI